MAVFLTTKCAFILKVEVLRQKYRNKDIEVDGGVGPSNIDIAAKVSIVFHVSYEKSPIDGVYGMGAQGNINVL